MQSASERAAQTIAAIASPPGGALRGIVRLSGPAAREIVAACARFADPGALSQRGAWRAQFHDGRGEQPLIVFWMPAPHSYTREDVAELHGWGASPLVDAVLERVLACGARLAEPGEFTRRAFESGRLDLTRAEGVLELVSASNEHERRAASALLFGGLSHHVDELRERLLDLRVLCEASLDFDEADTGHVPTEQLDALASAGLAALDDALQFERRRVRASGAPRVALVGAPNAGKSTLFNALCGAQALVSALPGATRDVLRANWCCKGEVFELIDTAGLDPSSPVADADDDPDVQAQAAGRAALESADLVVVVMSSAPDAQGAGAALELHLAGALRAQPGRPVVLAWSQCDRSGAVGAAPAALVQALGAARAVSVSAHTGAGLAALSESCRELLLRPGAPDGGSLREISERHLRALDEARQTLRAARAALREGAPLDQVAQTVRRALDALDAIGGRTSPDDVLERLFARFCIGK